MQSEIKTKGDKREDVCRLKKQLKDDKNTSQDQVEEHKMVVGEMERWRERERNKTE